MIDFERICNVVVFNKEGNKILFSVCDDKYCLVSGDVQKGEDPFYAAYRHLINYGGIKENDLEIKKFMEFEYYTEQMTISCFVGKLNKTIHETENCDFLKWVDVNSDFSNDDFMGNGIVNVMIREIKANGDYCFSKNIKWIGYDGTKYQTTFSLVESYKKTSNNSILMLFTNKEEKKLIDDVFRYYSNGSKLRIKYADFINALNSRNPKSTSGRIYKTILSNVDNLLIEDFTDNVIDKRHRTLNKYLRKRKKSLGFRLILTEVTKEDLKILAEKNIGGYYKVFSPIYENRK